MARHARIGPLLAVVVVVGGIGSQGAPDDRPPQPPPVEVTTVAEIDGAVGGVAVDLLGILHVADFGEKVWKVSPDGDVELLAWSLFGASGNAVDPRGDLYQSSSYGNTLDRIARDGTVTTITGELNGPVGVAIDDEGRLYVCNCKGNSISRVYPGGGTTTFVVDERFHCPNGITRDPEGNLYVVNFQDGRLFRVTPGGEIRQLAVIPGGGNGHVVFAAGALYVNDYPVPFLERTRVRPRNLVRRIRFPGLTERIEAALGEGGIPAATSAYRAYKESRPGRFTEVETNVLGYELLRAGKTEAAIECYEKSLELDPANENAVRMLEELGAR